MKYGLFIGVLFALNFLFAITGNNTLTVLSNAFMVLSVYVVYRLTLRFRDVENEGVISYKHSFLYIFMLYVLAPFWQELSFLFTVSLSILHF